MTVDFGSEAMPDEGGPMIVSMRFLMWEGMSLDQMGKFVQGAAQAMQTPPIHDEMVNVETIESIPSGKSIGMTFGVSGDNNPMPLWVKTYTPNKEQFDRMMMLIEASHGIAESSGSGSEVDGQSPKA